MTIHATSAGSSSASSASAATAATTIRRAVAGACLATVVLTAAACSSTASRPGASGTAPSQSSAAGSSTPSVAPAPTVTTAPASTPSSPTVGAPHACVPSQLAGRWTGVVGSAGMGQVSSDLALRNTSAWACTVDGYPAFTLYSAVGAALPTRISFVPAPVPLLIVQPGGWVHSELRYSANVPSEGELESGPCEPKAAYALVTIGGGGTVRADLDTAQPVCGRGRVAAKPYTAGPSSPAGG